MSHANTLYIDCFSGISGDMFLAALLDLGLSLDQLKAELGKLDLSGYEIVCEQNTTNSIAATSLTVKVTGKQPHRSWKTIRNLLEKSELDSVSKERAIAIFRILAEAEAKVHGCPVETVHFHEVGGMDSIIDIVGAAIGLTQLEITNITCAPLPMPHGWVECAHGKLPLPAPAVCEILSGVPSYGVDLSQELVTPTGAAIIKALAASFGPMPALTIDTIGYGAGSRTLQNSQPNLLRLLLGKEESVTEAQQVEVIETHIDDMNPELFPHVSEELLKAGALDVALLAMQMKKGRPGFLLRVVCSPATALPVKEKIFQETSAIGLRYRRENRWTLPRELGTVQTKWGAVEVKKVSAPHGDILTPEFDDCQRLAREKNIPLKEIYTEISRISVVDFQRCELSTRQRKE